MEMNPFTLDAEGKPFPLDMRGELDDTAYFKSGKKWGDVEFPLPFGRTMSVSEVQASGPLPSTCCCCGELGQGGDRHQGREVQSILFSNLSHPEDKSWVIQVIGLL